MEIIQYYGYIYKITIRNDESIMNNCYYIGQHKYQTKYKDSIYYGSGLLIKEYIKKWGLLGLKKQILYRAVTKEELNRKEAEYIGTLYEDDSFLRAGKCLNLRAGGDNFNITQETKLKLSKSHKNKKVSIETKNKISKTLKNKFKGKNSFAYGYKHTQEAKEKISQYNKGKKLSENTKQKLRECNLGRKLSEYHKKRLCENHANVKGKNNPAYGRKWYNDGIRNFFWL